MSSRSEKNRHTLMCNGFERAMESGQCQTHVVWYAFGSRAVRVRIVGNRLTRCLASPLCHLLLEPSHHGTPQLRIDLWDQEEVGVEPGLDVKPDPLGVSSSFFMSEDERYVTSVLQHSIASFDRQEQRIVGAACDAARLSLYEWGRPLHIPLTFWYKDQGLPLVHAALVSHGDLGILLAGPSEAGKTTASLSCLKAGFRYLGDDLAALQVDPEGVWGHSIYGSAFVDDGTLLRTSIVRDQAITGKYGFEDKKLLFISQLPPSRLVPKARIVAVALLSLGDKRQTNALPATKSDSLLMMARSSLQSGVLSPGRLGFETLGELCQRVPSFRVELGTDPQDIPGCLRDLAHGGLAPTTEGES